MSMLGEADLDQSAVEPLKMETKKTILRLVSQNLLDVLKGKIIALLLTSTEMDLYAFLYHCMSTTTARALSHPINLPGCFAGPAISSPCSLAARS